MKNLFGWINEIDLIFAGVVATCAIAIVILSILLSRGGHSIETKAVLDKVDGVRNRLENVDLRIERDHRAQANWMRRLLTRFGFLDAQDIVKEIEKTLKDDDIH